MADDERPGKLKLRYFPLGIGGKEFTIKVLAKRETRKSASSVVHEKNLVGRDEKDYFKFLKNHELNKIRRVVAELIRGTQIGLQETINVSEDGLLLLKEGLLALQSALKKQGEFIPKETLVEIGKYLKKIQDPSLVDFAHYCNELEFVADGKEAQMLGKIRSAYGAYKEQRSINPLKRLGVWEWLHERGEAKREFKEESKIIEIENMRFEKLSSAKIESESHQLIQDYKKFTEDFVELMTEMFVFKYILLHNAVMVANDIEDAIGKKRIDLPWSYGIFSRSLNDLFSEEKNALKGIRKSVDFLYEEITTTTNIIGKTIAISEKQKKLVRV